MMPTLQEAKDSRFLLISFKEAVSSGTYHGSRAIDIAKGLMFLESTILQAEAQIQYIAQNEIKAKNQVNEAIAAAPAVVETEVVAAEGSD